MDQNKLVDSISNKYNELGTEEKKELYNLFRNKDTVKELKQKLEQIIYYKRPPTPEEFLDYRNGWLSKKLTDSIYPHIREDFLNILNEEKNYFQISFYGCQRSGKTFCCRLLILYTIVFIHHLREPALFYKLSPLSNLSLYLVSYKLDKTRQLYLDHIYKWMDSSERFKRVKFQDKVKEEQYKIGYDKVVWSKATLVGEITLANNLQILLGNDNPNEILGSDLLQYYITEISYFTEEEGIAEDDVFSLYTSAFNRINSTVGNQYLTYLLLDTSANRIDSKIEKHILQVLRNDPDTYFTWRTQWEAQGKKLAPKYFQGIEILTKEGYEENRLTKELVKRGYAFNVITGNGDVPAQLVTSPGQLNGIPVELIDAVPIDLRKSYELDLIKSIKDIGGKPTSNESKFIQNYKTIHSIFVDYLRNIEGGIVLDSAEEPEGLIWNKIQDKFFDNVFEKKYFYRAPRAPRYIGCDTSFSNRGDLYGFGMVHKEKSIEMNFDVYVVDFCFAFMPGKNGINLSAVEFFILDLAIKGGMYIQSVSGDSHYIANIKQNIKDRNNIEVISQSVDTSLNPYQYLYSCLLQNRIKSGRNIFLKNNLYCLERTTSDKGHEKIDHPKGKKYHIYDGDFESSMAGINEKDCADALTQAVWSAYNDNKESGVIFEEENKKLMTLQADLSDSMRKAFNKLHFINSSNNLTNNKQKRDYSLYTPTQTENGYGRRI